MKLPVAIIGGGPVGLAAAAQLFSRGESFILFESGNRVGSSVRKWGHVRMFSPWKYNIDKAAASILARHGWVAPPVDDLHTGEELVEKYLQPLAALPELKPFIHLNSKVLSVGRKGLDKMKTRGRDTLPFVIRYEKDGEQYSVEARAVIDASGTWLLPNPVGAGGILAKGEQDATERIMYGIPDANGDHRDRYAGKRVLVVGSGHSAINTILDLNQLKNDEPETEIFWAIRKKSVKETYGGGENDQLPARGELGTAIKKLIDSKRITVFTPIHIDEIKITDQSLEVFGEVNGEKIVIPNIDEIVTNTGSRPDISFLREVRISIDPAIESVPALADLIDPNIHSCGTVRPHGEAELRQLEKDFYIVGMKSYGRAPTFLLATGYEQVRSVVAALVEDWEAAKRVELELPETGVCGSSVSTCCSVENNLTEAFSCGTGVSNKEKTTSCCSTEPVKTTSCCG